MARAINEMHGKILEKIGADRVIFPERDMALKVAKTLAFPHAIRTEELFPGYNVVEVKLPPVLHGVSLGKAQLRNRYGITVLAIKRDNEYRVSPSADEVLLKGDVIYLLGNEQQLRKFFREMVESRNGKVVEV